MSGDEELIASQCVDGWKPGLVVICARASQAPDPCDCGFIGEWERRSVFVWAPSKRVRSDRLIRRDRALGWPPRSSEPGGYMMAGYDERCPGCGDVERFTLQGEQVSRFAEQAKVLVSLAAHRAVRRAPSSGGVDR